MRCASPASASSGWATRRGHGRISRGPRRWSPPARKLRACLAGADVTVQARWSELMEIATGHLLHPETLEPRLESWLPTVLMVRMPPFTKCVAWSVEVGEHRVRARRAEWGQELDGMRVRRGEKLARPTFFLNDVEIEDVSLIQRMSTPPEVEPPPPEISPDGRGITICLDGEGFIIQLNHGLAELSSGWTRGTPKTTLVHWADGVWDDLERQLNVAGKTYPYVGPDDLLKIFPSMRSTIHSTSDAIAWMDGRAEGTVTFVVDLHGWLRIAARHSEHVHCAEGYPVLAAGELTLIHRVDDISAVDITNQSTGYCPDPSCWPAVAAALNAAGIRHGGGFTTAFVFRVCPACAQKNIIKDDVYECAVCGSDLSR